MSFSKSKRRQARIQAVQQLYAREMQGALSPDGAASAEPPLNEKSLPSLTRSLVAGATAHFSEIDRLLCAALQNWDLRRLGAVDRAILRAAVAEMIVHPELPPAVTINEAIEIARELASADSARFANGVLDRVRKEIGREARATN